MTVFGVDTYTTNADLIVACRDLGYLNDEWLTLDPTFGRGVFWKAWEPYRLRAHDIIPERARDGAMDFTNLSYPDGHFDAAVLDPPYRLNGTPDKWSPPDHRVGEFDRAYGNDQAVSWPKRMALCEAGIREVGRTVKPKGYLLVKCQDQVASGKVRWQTLRFTAAAESVGFDLEDMLHMQTNPRPQPAGRPQHHARRNYSTMLILRKKRRFTLTPIPTEEQP